MSKAKQGPRKSCLRDNQSNHRQIIGPGREPSEHIPDDLLGKRYQTKTGPANNIQVIVIIFIRDESDVIMIFINLK